MQGRVGMWMPLLLDQGYLWVDMDNEVAGYAFGRDDGKVVGYNVKCIYKLPV